MLKPSSKLVIVVRRKRGTYSRGQIRRVDDSIARSLESSLSSQFYVFPALGVEAVGADDLRMFSTTQAAAQRKTTKMSLFSYIVANAQVACTFCSPGRSPTRHIYPLLCSTDTGLDPETVTLIQGYGPRDIVSHAQLFYVPWEHEISGTPSKNSHS